MMKSRRLKWLLALGLLLAVLAVGLSWAHLQGKWALGRYKRALIARGEKLTIEQCRAPQPSKGENRFREFMLAVGRLQGSQIGSVAPPLARQTEPGRVVRVTDLEQWTSGRTNVNWAMLEERLAASSNLLSEAKDLLHEPVLDPDLNYHRGFNILMPHLAPLRALAQHLSCATSQALHESQAETALEHIKDMLAIAHLLEDEPLLISQLVRYSVLGLSADTTWQALQTTNRTDAQLAGLQQAWQSVEVLPGMIQALEMERAIMIETYAKLRASGTAMSQLMGAVGPGGPTGAGRGINSFDDLLEHLSNQVGQFVSRGILLPTWQFALSHADEHHYLTTVQVNIDVARDCARERSADRARQAKSLPQQQPESGLSALRHFVSRNLSAALDRGFERALTVATQKELVVAAIAIRRHTLRHGRPPAALAELIPEWLTAVPHDYWAGRPLIYTNLDGAPLLYSVGPDGRDDGGDPSADTRQKVTPMQNGRDMVWPVAATKITSTP